MNHIIPDSQCIAFEKGKFDTHGAMKNGIYTIVKDGKYVVSDENGIREIRFKAGDTIRNPKWILSESCGIFYKRAVEKIKNTKESPSKKSEDEKMP
jgi:hypothetical protein